MNWMSDVVPPKIRSFLRRETPENLWVKCPESGQLVFHKDLEANLFVVPGSGYHMPIAAKARLASFFDDMKRLLEANADSDVELDILPKEMPGLSDEEAGLGAFSLCLPQRVNRLN